MLRENLSVRGVHDEVVGIISAEVDVVSARLEVGHIEIPIESYRKIFTTPIEERGVALGNGITTSPMTGPWNNRIEGTERSWITR